MPHAAHFLAEVIEPPAAVVVVHRHDEGLNRNPVAAPEVFNILADLQNFGRELMTEDLGKCRSGENVGCGRRHDRAGDVFMQVRSTNARPQWLDQQLVRTVAVRLLDIFDPDVLTAVVSDSFHRRKLLLGNDRRRADAVPQARRETASDLSQR